MSQHRCHWANHELETTYHDTEWGVPLHDDRRHFEFLTLEGAQAGLSWLTVLKKRGFNFVGPTICYAYMQATGMVNDHLISCFRHKELLKLK
ncbi:DNA-3-methyladenine glycosylase I [Desulfovibrio sp. JC010]|uniref:DNA-3-methyladenine glycosylase I n=1 Tax=Desulfovibrio sp. JC010 TaxID=2593641 RepID=UPI0013D20D4F|nr:DNA-3-methyladenine glycosylase I [Desulfovibrio sp. JC010]NDV25711.1 DNA-3-methyladenine glycosylase I [Desulfovibrio sp. JC010]